MGILTGYLVLDCTMAMAGPFAALRMGDLGGDDVESQVIRAAARAFNQVESLRRLRLRTVDMTYRFRLAA